MCEYYCAFANSGEKDMVHALKGVAIRPRIQIEENNGISFAVSCRHCKEPLCVKSCITGALSVEDGVITVNRDKCVGCYTCILSCPYGCCHAVGKRRDSKVRAVHEKQRGFSCLCEGMSQ